jgi:hypothetical protein
VSVYRLIENDTDFTRCGKSHMKAISRTGDKGARRLDRHGEVVPADRCALASTCRRTLGPRAFWRSFFLSGIAEVRASSVHRSFIRVRQRWAACRGSSPNGTESLHVLRGYPGFSGPEPETATKRRTLTWISAGQGAPTEPPVGIEPTTYSR